MAKLKDIDYNVCPRCKSADLVKSLGRISYYCRHCTFKWTADGEWTSDGKNIDTGERQLTIPDVSNQREQLIDFVKEVASLDENYSCSNAINRAKELLKSINCC